MIAAAFVTLVASGFTSAVVITFGLRPRFLGEAGAMISSTLVSLDVACAAFGGLPRFFSVLIAAGSGVLILGSGKSFTSRWVPVVFLSLSGLGFNRDLAFMIVGKGMASSSNPSNCRCVVGLLLMKSMEAWMRRVTLVSQVA